MEERRRKLSGQYQKEAWGNTVKCLTRSAEIQFLLLSQCDNTGNVQSLSGKCVCERASSDDSNLGPVFWKLFWRVWVFGEDDLTSPKQETSVLRHRGYYSSCLRDKSCATACLTSQLGVVVFSFSFFFCSCKTFCICLWVRVALSADGDVSQMSESFCWLCCWLYSRRVSGVDTWTRSLSVLFCTKQRRIESIETCCGPFSHSKQSKNWV